MKDFHKLEHLFKLKSVMRSAGPGVKGDSSADHTWGCLILADYFLKKHKLDLDELKVFKLILYHDVIEIEAGDTFILDKKASLNKKQREREAIQLLKNNIPEGLVEDYLLYFKEYEENKTKEAKFAQAIDKLEPFIEFYKHKDWKKHGFTEEVIKEKKEKYFKPFPELFEFYKEVMKYLKQTNRI